MALVMMSDDDWRRSLPSLKAALVTARELAPTDAPALFELLTDPPVTEHISPPPPSLAAFEGFIAWTHRERALGRGVCFGIVPVGLQQAVGLIQVRALVEPGFFVSEWGFAIGAAFWSTGVFEEAARLVARFAFDVLHVHRLEARAVVRNGRGNGALQKLGATAEALLAKSFRRADKYEEQLLWSLLPTDLLEATRGRFAEADTKRRIREAADAMLRDLRVHTRPRPRNPPPLYPFFVTDAGRAPTCPVCGTPLMAQACPNCV